MFEDISEQTILDAASVVNSVATHASEFDRILTTGASGVVSKQLLEASGINPRRILHLGPHANTNIYKVTPSTAELTLRDRINLASFHMREAGVSLGQDSVCIVDEIVDTGVKAVRFLGVLSQIEGLLDFSFAPFSAPVLVVNSLRYGYRRSPSQELVAEIRDFAENLRVGLDQEQLRGVIDNHLFVSPILRENPLNGARDNLFYLLSTDYSEAGGVLERISQAVAATSSGLSASIAGR